ncbi:MAG TPA: hypothetical protein DDX19_27870 [Rhodopirellula baltica]|nr:hypothetical protein RBWH47_00570 [Rhodopirellula baltica WH47]EKK00283.1 hypothetical protein RBSH_04438 [Rhodopirellula baltica SH28]HBE66501.1 hypothetical protein [Rhodopirellula baltica]
METPESSDPQLSKDCPKIPSGTIPGNKVSCPSVIPKELPHTTCEQPPLSNRAGNNRVDLKRGRVGWFGTRPVPLRRLSP